MSESDQILEDLVILRKPSFLCFCYIKNNHVFPYFCFKVLCKWSKLR
jgi:hypothetical protein